MLRIGVSSCFLHADPQRAIFKGKTLLYLVQDVSDWLLEKGLYPYLIPTLPSFSSLTLKDIVTDLDGLVLQGGSDVAPETYGETPIKPEWSGDMVRDLYELALVREFRAQKKPVLGLCRGLQLLNVAFEGGTLYQDIGTQINTATKHRDWDVYENNFHDIELSSGSKLAALYPGHRTAKINSVHHQAIKDLGRGLVAEAKSRQDGLIEAIRFDGPDYVVGVQWHPEFQDRKDLDLLPTAPLLEEFITEAKKRRKGF